MHFHNISAFQRNVVKSWNPIAWRSSKCFTPTVSTRDKITTDGFVMAVIELLACGGMIMESKDEKNN